MCDISTYIAALPKTRHIYDKTSGDVEVCSETAKLHCALDRTSYPWVPGSGGAGRAVRAVRAVRAGGVGLVILYLSGITIGLTDARDTDRITD